MKRETKLFIQLGILFLLVVLLATINQVFITRLADEARKITLENNNSIDFAEKMLQSLDTIQAYHQRQYLGAAGSSPDDPGHTLAYTRAIDQLAINIRAEENNITEPGELEATQRLRLVFTNYQNAYQTIDQYRRFDVVTYYMELIPQIESIRSCAYAILEINLKASNQKSNRPRELASQPANWMQSAGILSAILALLVWMAGAYSLTQRKPCE